MIGNYTNMSIMLVMLQYPCVLLEENLFVGLLGIETIIGQGFLLMNLLAVALFTLLNSRLALTLLQKKLFLLFLFIGGYLAITTIAQHGNGEIFLITLKICVKQVIIGVLFLVIISNKSFDLQKFIRFYLNVTVIICLFALFGYFGFLLGFIDTETVLIKSKNQLWIDLHGFGYLNTITLAGYREFGFLPRMQAYWTESAMFAHFLLLPVTFVATSMDRKKIMNNCKACIIILSFILTFSVASYLSLLGWTTIFLIVKKMHLQKKYFFWNKSLSITIAILAFTLLIMAVESSQDSTIIGKDLSHTIRGRYEAAVELPLRTVLENPFGDFNSYLDRSELGISKATIGAPIALILQGGVFLIFLLAFFLFQFLRVAKKNGWQYSYPLYGFLSLTTAMCWYGNFFEYLYLLLLVLFTCLFSSLDPSKLKRAFS